ncbi:unnamed protein product, partial [Gadus morhua 'NCC']
MSHLSSGLHEKGDFQMPLDSDKDHAYNKRPYSFPSKEMPFRAVELPWTKMSSASKKTRLSGLGAGVDRALSVDLFAEFHLGESYAGVYEAQGPNNESKAFLFQ